MVPERISKRVKLPNLIKAENYEIRDANGNHLTEQSVTAQWNSPQLHSLVLHPITMKLESFHDDPRIKEIKQEIDEENTRHED